MGIRPCGMKRDVRPSLSVTPADIKAISHVRPSSPAEPPADLRDQLG